MNSIIYLSLFALFACNVNGRAIDEPDNTISDDRTFVEINEWVKVEPIKIRPHNGNSVELECDVIGSPPPSITWIRGEKSIDNVSKLKPQISTNFHNFFSLLLLIFFFRWIERFDFWHFCRKKKKKILIISFPLNFAEFFLKFFFSFLLTHKQLDFESNAITESNPTSRARAISRLIIDRSIIGDRTFTCVGRSGSKTAIEMTNIYPNENESQSDLLALNAGITSINSNGLKKVRILSFYSTIFASIGRSIVLPCKAAGKPHPEIYWLDNAQNVIEPQNSRFKVLPNGDLLISTLKWSHMGTYTCVARNPISKDTAETFVYPSVSVTKIFVWEFSSPKNQVLTIKFENFCSENQF